MAISSAGITINGTRHSLTYNSANGKWEAVITAPGSTSFNLDGGHYACAVDATNTAGTQTTANTADPTVGNGLKLVVKETIAPVITIINPSEGAYIGTNSPEVTFTLRDETGGSGVKLSSLVVKVDGVTVPSISSQAVTGGYDCSFTASVLADGAHTVTVNVQDNDGNAAVGKSRAFTVDTVPPVLDLASPPDGLITAEPILTIQGVTNDATSPTVSVTIKLNGTDQGVVAVDGGGNFSKIITLAEGANTIVVTAKDTVGRETVITRNVVLDTTAPEFKSVVITPTPADAGATLTISVEVVG